MPSRLRGLERLPLSVVLLLLKECRPRAIALAGTFESARRTLLLTKSGFSLAKMRRQGSLGLPGKKREARTLLKVTFLRTCSMLGTSTCEQMATQKERSAAFAFA